MITFWKFGKELSKLDSFQDNSYINVVAPTTEEIEILRSKFDIPEEFLSDVLDVDERSRMEIEGNLLLIIIRVPVYNPHNGVPYTTIPLGFIIGENFVLSICIRETEVIQNLENNRIKNILTDTRIDFLLSIFLHTTNSYHKFLKTINIQTNRIEKDLERSTRNEELHKLLNMEKCLVYFTTSLRANELLLARLRNSKYIKPGSYSEELLEDVIIENRQAIEMANIYSDIQSGMMDAFASIISNNLNIVMKQLTTVTVILMIPTLVSSFFGMNIPNSLENNKYSFIGILAISILLSLIGGLLIRFKRWI